MVFTPRMRWLSGRYADVDGIPFEMPVRSRTSPALFAGFSIDPVAAQRLLPGQELHAARLWSRGMLLIAVVDYRDTTIGRYVEVCVGVLCTHGRRRPPRALPLLAAPLFGTGVYIYDLPVSSLISVKGGLGIWGMAKRQANLDFIIGGDTVSSQYDLDGELVLRIDVPRTTALVPFALRGRGYGTFRGLLSGSSLVVRGRAGLSLRDRSTMLLLGDHPRARVLRDLDIDPRPLFAGFAPRLDGVLDDHVETWFVTADEPPGPAPVGLADVIDLPLSEDWLDPPNRSRSGEMIRRYTPRQRVGREARPEIRASTTEVAAT